MFNLEVQLLPYSTDTIVFLNNSQIFIHNVSGTLNYLRKAVA